MALASVEEAIKDFQDGKMVIIVDDEDRENEGDLAVAAEKVTPEIINFMATHGRGLICAPIIAQRLEQLKLPTMVDDNTSRNTTAFTVSIDVRKGATTGISAFDRSATIQSMIDPMTEPEDLARPGHIFPLRYQEGGVLVRAGQTEGSVDLSKLAGLYPAAVICEVMADDGTMARMPQLETFTERFGIRIVSVAQIIAYRRLHETMVERVAEARLPTRYGDFTAVAYKSTVDAAEHLALVMGDVSSEEPHLVRVHSECLTGDVFGSQRCDCGAQIDLALQTHCGRGPRGLPLHAPGGQGHWTAQQDKSIRPPGQRPGYGGGQRPAWLQS